LYQHIIAEVPAPEYARVIVPTPDTSELPEFETISN
jgi:hypothetical protein